MGADTSQAIRSFAAALKVRREAADLTQPELAKKAGMSLHGLTKIEYGLREPRWGTVLALAAALGCTPNDFVAEPAKKTRSRK